MGKRIRGLRKKKKEVTVDLGYEKTYLIETPEECEVLIGKLHGIGARSIQQDSFGVSGLEEELIEKKGVLAILADGMGGLSDGEKASMATVISCLNYFETHDMGEPVSEGLLAMAENANREMKEVLGSKGVSGSTLAAALVRGGKLFWLSVGDSRIFLYRDGMLTQLSKDHNYAAQLQEMVEAGEITQEEALCDGQKDALTSFIGINLLKEIDYSEEPVKLEQGDRVLLMSDGVYRSVTAEEMAESMQLPVCRTMMHLGMQIEGKRKKNQDNYTAIVLEEK